MLKAGHTAMDDPLSKNIEACTELARIVASSLGPNGLAKLVIDHLEKIHVTSSAAAITTVLEVQHPAANIIAMAATAQQDQSGDATNFVTSFSAELLRRASGLLREGLVATEIVTGYKAAYVAAKEILPTLVSHTMPAHSEEGLVQVIKPAIASKQGCLSPPDEALS